MANFLDYLGPLLGALSGAGSSLQAARDKQDAEMLAYQKLRQGEGTFEPSAAPDQTFLQRLLSAPLPQGMVRDAGGYRTFRPYDALGDEGAIALGLSTPKAVPAYSGAGPWAIPGDASSPWRPPTTQDLLAGGDVPTGSTPATASTTQQVAMPWASKLRLDPKAKVALVLEQLKEKARVKELAEKTRLDEVRAARSDKILADAFGPKPTLTETTPAPLTPGLPTTPAPITPAPRATLRPAVMDKVRQVAARLDTNPDYLIQVMGFETGGTFSPAEKNRAGSGATGMIGFMPKTAEGLGTTTKALADMTQEQQLDYVEKHLAPFKGKLGTLHDVYMAVLQPAAIGKTPETVLFKEGTKDYEQNAGLDKGKKGYVTAGDATQAVRDFWSSPRAATTPTPSAPARQQNVVATGNTFFETNAPKPVLNITELEQLLVQQGVAPTDASGQAIQAAQQRLATLEPQIRQAQLQEVLAAQAATKGDPRAPQLQKTASENLADLRRQRTALGVAIEKYQGEQRTQAETKRKEGLAGTPEEKAGLDLLVGAHPELRGTPWGALKEEQRTEARDLFEANKLTKAETTKTSIEEEQAKRLGNVFAKANQLLDDAVGKDAATQAQAYRGAENLLASNKIPPGRWGEQLTNRLAEQKDLHAGLKGDQRFFADPATFRLQPVNTKAQATEKGLVPVTKDGQDVIAGTNKILNRFDTIESLLTKAYGPKGLLKDNRDTGTWLGNAWNRGTATFTMATNLQSQLDTEMKSLRADVATMGLSLSRTVFGERGQTHAGLVTNSLKEMPSVFPIPDTREQAYAAMANIRQYIEAGLRIAVPDAEHTNPTPSRESYYARLLAMEKNGGKVPARSTASPAAPTADTEAAKARLRQRYAPAAP